MIFSSIFMVVLGPYRGHSADNVIQIRKRPGSGCPELRKIGVYPQHLAAGLSIRIVHHLIHARGAFHPPALDPGQGTIAPGLTLVEAFTRVMAMAG